MAHMKKWKASPPVDLAQAEVFLEQWRKSHNTPAKVVAAHRKVLLQRVSESMAFENQPVSTDRLKELMRTPKKKAS